MATETKTKLKPKETEEPSFPKELQEFIEAGVQFGHMKSSVHAGMFPYIFGTRNNVHIIDVAKTKEKLEISLEFIKGLISEGKTILFVGTKLPARGAVKEAAEKTGMPYVSNRWYGGTLTNWASISERITYLKDLRAKKGSDEWKKYPKHERLEMDKKIKKLEYNLGGIEKMEGLPGAVFIVDLHGNELAAREARRMKIPCIGIADTNVNPKLADFPIPASDGAVSSIKLILDKVGEAILKNKKGKVAPKQPAKALSKGVKK
ncbi:MAG: 30S ribosomal protein S2 [Candidatus Spechtbacteria bacterium]|nr:30S ribosomal protein S2 [Candidatus Spechtbacteria bacterium]